LAAAEAVQALEHAAGTDDAAALQAALEAATPLAPSSPAVATGVNRCSAQLAALEAEEARAAAKARHIEEHDALLCTQAGSASSKTLSPIYIGL